MAAPSGRGRGAAAIKPAYFLLAGGILLAVTGIIASVFISGMLNILARHERESIRWKGGVANGLISSYTAELQAFTADWAASDAIRGVAGAATGTMADDALFVRGGLSFAALKDADGRDIFSKFYSLTDNREVPFPAGFADFISGGTAAGGFLFYDGVCYYVCQAIVPGRGVLYAGGVFDEAAILRITGGYNISLSFTDVPGGLLEKGEYTAVTAGQISYYRQIADYFGGKSIALKVDETRALYKSGLESIRNACVICAALLFVLAVAASYALDRRILRPAERLCGMLETIPHVSCRADMDVCGGTPVIKALGEALNAALGRIDNKILALEESTVPLEVLKSILDGMESHLYVSDMATDEIIFINEKMRRHLGLETDPAGRSCWEVMQPDAEGRCGFCPNYALLESPNTPVHWEEENPVTGHYFRNVASVVEWTDGRPVQLRHSTDITDIKLIESALSERLRHQELMSAVSLIFSAGRHDTPGHIRKALRMTGEFMLADQGFIAEYDSESNTMRCVYEWCREGVNPLKEGVGEWPLTPDMPTYEAMMVRGYAAIPDLTLESLPFSYDAEKRGLRAFVNVPIEISGTLWGVLGFTAENEPRYWTEGDIQLTRMIGGIISGVIGRVIAEEKLSSTRQVLSAVLENAPMAIYWKGMDLSYSGANTHFEKLTGYSQAFVMGKTDFDIYPADEAGVFYEGDVSLLEGGRDVLRADMLVSRPVGEPVWIHINKSLIRDEEGRAVFIVGIFEDITEQKKLEREIIEAKEMAEQGNRAKGEFLSRMSHEMRTPMTAIIGMTEIARSSGDPVRKEYCLERINEASKHLLAVINDILDMSKIEANKLELSLAEFDFRKVLDSVLGVVGFRAEQRKQTLAVNIGSGVPRLMTGDETRFAQVLTNLLANAVKFTPDGGTITMNVGGQEGPGGLISLLVEVIDTGIGISPEQQARLFTSFEQADGGVARRYGGTGLGLVISKRIVEMMGGRIWIESELGKGAKFAFTVMMQAGGGCPAQAGGQTVPDAVFDFSGHTILLAEDVDVNREIISVLLEDTGVAIDFAKNGLEAVALFSDNPGRYSAILMDIHMPYMDGYEATRQIRSLSSDKAGKVPVVAMTANVFREDIEMCLSAGMNAHIGKPVNTEQLLSVLGRYLRQDADKAELPER